MTPKIASRSMTVTYMQAIRLGNKSFTLCTCAGNNNIIFFQVKTFKSKRTKSEGEFVRFIENRNFLNKTCSYFFSYKYKLSFLKKDTCKNIGFWKYFHHMREDEFSSSPIFYPITNYSYTFVLKRVLHKVKKYIANI